MSPAAGTRPQRQQEDTHTLVTQMPLAPIFAHIPAPLPVEACSSEDKVKDLTLTAQIWRGENYRRGHFQWICHHKVSKYSVSLIYPKTYPTEERKLANAHIFY